MPAQPANARQLAQVIARQFVGQGGMEFGIREEKSHKKSVTNERDGMLYCLQRRNRLLFARQP
jgi:hypothetical protein